MERTEKEKNIKQKAKKEMMTKQEIHKRRSKKYSKQ